MEVEAKDIYWAFWQMKYACNIADKAILIEEYLMDDMTRYRASLNLYGTRNNHKGKFICGQTFYIDVENIKKYESKQHYFAEIINTFITNNKCIP